MTTQINLTQLRDYLERIQPKQVTLRRAEVLALIDTAEAAIAVEAANTADPPKWIACVQANDRLRETLNRYTTQP